MIRKPRTQAIFILLSSVCLSALPTSAQASNVCQMTDGFIEKGIGGTGHTDGVGTGGTGGSTPKIEGNGGIGGTGAKPRPRTDEKGLGGTGILAFVSGTIYKHGSICVNGLRITYNAQTPVMVNGRTATPDAIKLGQQVEVYALPSATAGELIAQSVKIDYALQGPIESLDPATSSLRVMGERVVVQNLSDWSKYKVGDIVQISGLRDQAGRVQASSLSLTEGAAPESVKGPVRISSDGQIFVGFTPVAHSESTKDLKSGETARITGAWSGQKLVPQEVTRENTLPLEKANYISIEGYFKPASQDTSAQIGAYKAPVAQTERLEEGQRIILSGYLDDSEKLEQEQLRTTSPVPTFIDPPALNKSDDKNAPHQEGKETEASGKAKHESDDDAGRAAAAITPQASGDEGHDREHESESTSDDKDDNTSDDKDGASESESHGTDDSGTEAEHETDNQSEDSTHDGDSTETPDDASGGSDSSDAAESATESESDGGADSATSEAESTDEQASDDNSAEDSSSDNSSDNSGQDSESDHESEHEDD